MNVYCVITLRFNIIKSILHICSVTNIIRYYVMVLFGQYKALKFYLKMLMMTLIYLGVLKSNLSHELFLDLFCKRFYPIIFCYISGYCIHSSLFRFSSWTTCLQRSSSSFRTQITDPVCIKQAHLILLPQNLHNEV
jgi:hypothetical protein